MTIEQRQFAIDLLKALDFGMGCPERSIESYEEELTSTSKKEIKKTIQCLINMGYKKC